MSTVTIDESLYSRQLYTIGREAMGKLTTSSILITCKNNFSGLAVEIAKCVILAGVGKVSCNAGTDLLCYNDLASNYYVDESDIGKPFLTKVVNNLSLLNSYVQVEQIYDNSPTDIKHFDVIIFCDYDKNELIGFNYICRQTKTKFIMASSYGLCFNLFCDFGDQYYVNDINGENPKTGMIKCIDKNKIVTSDPHQLFDEDHVFINFGINNIVVNNNEYKIKFIDKFSFELYDVNSNSKIIINDCDDDDQDVHYMANASFTQVKKPTIIKFMSLNDAFNEIHKKNNDDLFIRFDTNNWNMPRILNAFMCAYDDWKCHNKQSLTVDHFVPYFKCYYSNNITDDIMITLSKLLETVTGRVCGIDAICGAICAQEVIKACTNKFMPNNQFLHFEALNILPDDYLTIKKLNHDDYKPIGSRYDGQIRIFGKKYMNVLKNKRLFIVGAGAIGCEHLKNFCMMGIKNIVITDMDRIENSNLNRQFLFRKDDIGSSKSLTASKKAKQINNDISITAYENRIGVETAQTVYNNEFFNNIDIVATALDNIDARLFVDSLCTKYDKPMLDSGTLGSKGSIQCVVPYLTESYGEYKEQAEQNIPLCTLKMFPYNYEHVVQYALDQFNGFFNKIPNSIIKARTCGLFDNIVNVNKHKYDDIVDIYNDLKIAVNYVSNYEQCCKFAYLNWFEMFNTQIDNIILKYPYDHVNEDGTRFWSGNKLFPKKTYFDHCDIIDSDFIKSFANIWANIFGIQIDDHNKYIKNIVTEHVHSNNEQTNENTMDFMLDTIKQWGKKINVVNPVEFEKDDDTNYHIDFVTSLANRRAINYSIDHKDKHTTKGIAGKIIPAIATTTSVVSGLVSLETYKLIYGSIYSDYNNLDKYRYGSFNLAIQSFGFSESNKPSVLFKLDDIDFTVWTKIKLNKGSSLSSTSIKNFVEKYSNINFTTKSKQSVVEIDMIFNDNGIIYPNTDEKYLDQFTDNNYMVTFQQSDDNDEYDESIEEILTNIIVNVIIC